MQPLDFKDRPAPGDTYPEHGSILALLARATAVHDSSSNEYGYKCWWRGKYSSKLKQYTIHRSEIKTTGCLCMCVCSRYMPGVAQRVGRGIALLFHDRGTRRG